jgi:N-acetylglucosamine kinase-like BadF-type ATPase
MAARQVTMSQDGLGAAGDGAESMVIGVDAGNSKTELVVVRLDGVPIAYVRGPGTNAHGRGAEGCVADIGRLVARAAVATPAEHGAFFLCGVDIPEDVADVSAVVARTGWVRGSTVDNDSFALLRAGSDAADVVAVVCGAGINCVGRGGDGHIARYPSLGWETGDWGGSVMLGQDVLFHAARAEDGRGRPSVLPELVGSHFGMSVPQLGEAIRYRRIPVTRLGELAPAVVAAAADGDEVARTLVERLAEEVVLMAARALADLGVESADVVLGGGMLRGGSGLLFDEVVERLARVAPHARPVAAEQPPVVGAALVALEAAGASPDAAQALRAAFRAGLRPE